MVDARARSRLRFAPAALPSYAPASTIRSHPATQHQSADPPRPPLVPATWDWSQPPGDPMRRRPLGDGSRPPGDCSRPLGDGSRIRPDARGGLSRRDPPHLARMGHGLGLWYRQRGPSSANGAPTPPGAARGTRGPNTTSAWPTRCRTPWRSRDTGHAPGSGRGVRRCGPVGRHNMVQTGRSLGAPPGSYHVVSLKPPETVTQHGTDRNRPCQNAGYGHVV